MTSVRMIGRFMITPVLFELQREVDQPFFLPVHFAEIQLRTDLTDLVANPLRDGRRLRVVEDDALLAVEPARSFVDFGDDRVEVERRNAIAQDTVRAVERLALPDEQADELRDLEAVVRARRDDCGPFGGAVRNRTRLAGFEQIVELSLRHL